MSYRAQRRAALAKFRSAKQRRELGEEDDLFDGNIKEEEDVYDVVDQDEYESLVQSRRQREDFVVDDGKLFWKVEDGNRSTAELALTYSLFLLQTAWVIMTMVRNVWGMKKATTNRRSVRERQV